MQSKRWCGPRGEVTREDTHTGGHDEDEDEDDGEDEDGWKG